MQPFGVVTGHIPVHCFKSLLKGLKALPPQAFFLQDAVERFNVGILVWQLLRNALMLQIHLLAAFIKLLAFELRAIVCPNDQQMLLAMYMAPQQRFLHHSGYVFGMTRLAPVISHNPAVKHIDDALAG